MKIKNQIGIKKKKSPPKSLSQHKSKSKSKEKNHSFNPLQYLNALIQLTNDTNILKLKKNKLPQKRDLSSALTIATPAMEKTISSSKIRCKSSYSQYRKKSATSNLNNLKQVLNVNFNNYIITEEEDNCIKFTSISSSNNSHHQTPTAQIESFHLRQFQPQLKNPKLLQFNHSHGIDYNYYAKKIQRAWKSFQTYKVISKYYRHFKKQKRIEKQQSQNERRLQFAPRHKNYEGFQQNQQECEVPSVSAYLNNYYDVPIFENDNKNLISAHEQLLQRTVKFKIRNPQYAHHNKESVQDDRLNVLKAENSESENQLNLTQKLNEIKEYIEKECNEESNNLPVMSQTPTIEIKKSSLPLSFRNRQSSPSDERNSKNENSQENQSTEKKTYQNLNTKIPNRLQTNSYQSELSEFKFGQELDRSPTLKDDFGSSLKKEAHKKYKNNDQKQASLVDSMIRKETQKYNEMLSLIEICKIDQSKQNKNSPNILTQLLKKLQHHKSQLQEGKQQNLEKFRMKGNTQRSGKEGSQCGNNSFLAFESKDIYNSFENSDFKSEQKNTTQNHANNKKKESLMKKVQILAQNKSKKVEVEQAIVQNLFERDRSELLMRFSSFMDKQEQKLTDFIMSNKKQPQVDLWDSNQESSSSQNSFQTDQQIDLEMEEAKSKMLTEQSKQKSQNDQSQNDGSQNDGSSIYSFWSSGCESDGVNKMLRQHSNLIEIKKDRSVKNLMKLVDENKISKELFEDRLNQIEQKFEIQRKSIETKKKLYIKSIHSIKKQAIQFQKELIISEKKAEQLDEFGGFDGINWRKQRNLGIRKSFSAQSMVLKCILKQPVLNKKQIMNQFLIRQEEIKQFDDDLSDEDENEVQEGIEENYNQSQGQRKEQIEEEKMKGKDHGVKINHKQNNIEDSQVNQFQNLSELLPRHALNSETQDCIQHQAESRQLKKECLSNAKEVSAIINAAQYAQCDEVWVKFNINPIGSIQLPSQNSPSQSQTNLYLNQHINPTDLEDAMSQTSDQLLIDEHSKQNQLSQKPIETQPQETVHNPTLSSSSLLIQRCSQELQQLIESQLINELLEAIYLNDSMLTLFKPFIEQIFQFTPITDSTILHFIHQELPNHFPPFPQLIQRANQKINPTSAEILRLVRDFEFQIDQYELILSEDIFKNTRKSIETSYLEKSKLKNSLPINSKIHFQNSQVSAKVQIRQIQKRTKVEKYLGYERDMKIMYMKAVFNCLNQFLIQEKSIATHVNARSTIGTGELSLSIKEFNIQCSKEDVQILLSKSQQRIQGLLKNKCMLPSFKNHKDVGLFQKQMLRMIKNELDESEYKWVTYMDEVLQIWNEMANQIVDDMFIEVTYEMALMKQKEINV